MNPIVIVGSGMAGYTLARELRKRAADAELVLITADDGASYSKPMLSTALAQQKSPEQLVQASAEAMAAQLRMRILTRTRVKHIDTVGRQVHFDGESLDYSRLVLALGADTLDPRLGGNAGGAALSVNDLGDYNRFRALLTTGSRVAVLGGGLIGCEFANDLAAAGFAVEVVHPAAWPLDRLLPEVAARSLVEALQQHGVRWHFGRKAQALNRADDGALSLQLDDGSTVTADVVVSAIGLRPRIALAQESGLAVARGIVVDRWLKTSAPDVFALGDCAEVEGLVLPFVQPLLIQARALAATLAGTPTALDYPAMPVVVKTPACPIAVASAKLGVAWSWQLETRADGHCALQVDASGKLVGFALAGAAVSERQTLAKQLPPAFDPL